MDVGEFVRGALPSPPARVLEVGCGAGDLALALDADGYDVLAIDPDAPEGPIFRRVTLEELDDPGRFDAVVAVRSLHHVHPLEAGLDKLASLAPLIVVDEFAPDRIDGPTQDWYEGQHRLLVASGHDPPAPASLDEWRERHADLHPSTTLIAELDARYERRSLEWGPYFYRWLQGPATEALERTLVETGLIQPVGYRFVGVRRG